MRFSPAVVQEPRSGELRLPHGTLRTHERGDPNDPPVVCVPGVSANARSFDYLAAGLARAGRRVIALDLRGRGWSDLTGPGSYGWASHARDVVDAAGALGLERFDLVGHSMGAYVGLEVARRAPARLGRLVLIDAIGAPDPASLVPILAAVERLGRVFPSADAYVEHVRQLRTVPWNPFWETHYRYDLVEVPGGVRARTDCGAVLEDLAQLTANPAHALWAAVTMPALLLRSALPLGSGFIVPAAERGRFLAAVPQARAVDIDANHYAIVMHPETLDEFGGSSHE